MGIKSLLPQITPYLIPRNISYFKNSTIGIDGHAWLHTCILPCAAKLFNGEDTDQYCQLFLKKIQILTKLGIKPVVVFDGDPLPSKKEENIKRSLKRKEAYEIVKKMIEDGEPGYFKYMQAALSITPEMLEKTVKLLNKEGIETIQAPYESDAQLTFLINNKYIDHILTEDSDMIVHGCKSVLYKFRDNKVMHYCRETIYNRLCPESKIKNTHQKSIPNEKVPTSAEKYKLSTLLANLMNISILSGCDYLENIPGVGINTLIKYWQEEEIKHTFQTNQEIKNDLNIVKSILRTISRKKEIPPSYFDLFIKARNTFLFQVVYDPIRKYRVYKDGTETQRKDVYFGVLSSDQLYNTESTIPRNQNNENIVNTTKKDSIEMKEIKINKNNQREPLSEKTSPWKRVKISTGRSALLQKLTKKEKEE